MAVCILCGKETKKEVSCSLLDGVICMACCFAVSSGDPIINKVRKERNYTKEDILAKCAECIRTKIPK
ncbi:MAG: hypothetical protein JW983_05375 [Elusimicrobia bacterium]|nr:hypothetical protein [Elusimicrobiota bacterium]